MPTASVAKHKLLTGLATTRRHMLDVLELLPAARREEVFLGSWSARHLVAHLIGWDITNVQAAKDVLAGQLPVFYAAHDREWASYNAQLVKRYSKGAFARLLSRAQRSQAALLNYLQGVSASEIRQDHGVRFRGYKVTVERLLMAELSDERTHLRQLRQFARARAAVRASHA